jgi:hypothetical protein
MTVKELIEELKTYNPDMRVVQSGYEGGFSDIEGPFDTLKLTLNYHDAWYYGPHEATTNLYHDSDKELVKTAVDALWIS